MINVIMFRYIQVQNLSNKYVFRQLLNSNKDRISRIERGREFQIRGAALEKQRFLKLRLSTSGSWSKVLSLEIRRDWRETFRLIRQERYAGANPFKHLKTSTQILKLMRKLTGSKCALFRYSVVEVPIFRQNTNLTEALINLCSFLMSFAGSPQ